MHLEFENIDNQLPYNPSDVDIRQQRFSVDQVMNMITNSEIELWREADYQRKSSYWKNEQKSRLIESLIMRIPLPIFYFDGSDKPWKVIDGLHRLTSLYLFLKGKSFELKNLEYLKDLEGKTFYELPFKYRRVIEEATLEAYVVNPGTPDKVKLNIFQRINTLGSSLSRQEIRNAYYREGPVDFLNELSSDETFLAATQRKITPSRMRDKEVVLRFFSFYLFLHQYSPPMEQFLDNSIERVYEIEKHRLAEITMRFRKSMIACRAIFGNKAFFILNNNGEKISSTINIALFEAWSVCIAHLTNDEIDRLENSRDIVMIQFIRTLQNIDFHKSISASTSSKKAVITRFSFIENLINEIIHVS